MQIFRFATGGGIRQDAAGAEQRPGELDQAVPKRHRRPVARNRGKPSNFIANTPKITSFFGTFQYLTKQTVALREVNDSRLRIYEQLEVSIQDLERANHRLAVENANDKKQIKNLTVNIDTLESRCEELQSTVDELTVQIDAYKRKAQKAQTELTAIKDDTTAHSAIIANDNNDSRCVAKQKSPVTHRNQVDHKCPLFCSASRSSLINNNQLGSRIRL